MSAAKSYTTEEIETLLAGLSHGGDWQFHYDGQNSLGYTIAGLPDGVRYQFGNEKDAEFVAASPAIIRQLLQRVRDLDNLFCPSCGNSYAELENGVWVCRYCGTDWKDAP